MSGYQEITPISRNMAERIISEGSPEDVALTLVRLAYHDPDWTWVQDACIRLSTHEDKWVRRACAICFGHLARIHGNVDKEKVLPILARLSEDFDVKGEAEDAIEDFKVFLK